jgi:hypothetical protein
MSPLASHDRNPRARLGRRIGCVTLAAAAAAAAAALFPLVRPPAGEPVAVEVAAVPLDPAQPARNAVGALRYRGGLWLRSRDPRFGGLSDLRVSEDGARLYAVSDCGRGFTARLSYDDGRLVGLEDARLIDLVGLDGRKLGAQEIDAESLVLTRGTLEVGFEGRPRFFSYTLDPPFGGPARSLPIPPGVLACGENEGLETVADLGGSRRLLVCEGRRGPSETVPAWVGEDASWSERSYPLLFEGGLGGEPFRPTAASALFDGDVLVLERRYPPIGVRVVRVSRAELEGEGPLHPREVARLEPPLTLDNYEGIDARRDSSGATLVYLLSDDNNCGKVAVYGPMRQRTLLVMFSLEG